MIDSSSLMNEWLSIVSDRHDRLREQERTIGKMVVFHPLCTGSSIDRKYAVQLQTDDCVMPMFYFLVPARLESFQDVQSMLKDTAIGCLLEAGWYVVNWFEAGGSIDA